MSLRRLASNHRAIHGVMLLLIAVAAITSFFFGEKVPAGGGLGWDGLTYGQMVRRLPDMIALGELSTYYAQRILPAFVVRCLLQLADLPFSTSNIVKGFEVYNFALLLAGGVIWKLIADRCELTWRGRWLGFAGLFVSFEASKQTLFYPVLTDPTALVASLAVLLFYLTRRPRALFVTSVVAAFAWPTMALTGALLALFPFKGLGDVGVSGGDTTDRGRWRRYVGVCLALIALGLLLLLGKELARPVCVHAYLAVFEASPHALQLALGRMAPVGDDPCGPLLRLVTGLASVLGVGLLLHALLRDRLSVRGVRATFAQLDVRCVLLALATLAVPVAGVRLISSADVPNPSGPMVLLVLSLLPQPLMFFLPLVTAVSFWGPVVLIVLLWWSGFCGQAARLGVGFQCVVAVGLLLALASEPRFVTSSWPFLVLGGAMMVERMRPAASFWWVFAAAVLLLGQFWLRLTAVPWPADDYALLTEFPKQAYFMHYGLWMGWPAYAGQAAGIAAVAGLLWVGARGLSPRWLVRIQPRP